MLDKILDYVGKIFTILLLASLGIAMMTGAIFLFFKCMYWLGGIV